GQTFRRFAAGAVNAVCVDARGTVWAGTDGAGLYRVAGAGGVGGAAARGMAAGGDAGETLQPAGVAGAHSYALLAGDRNELWIGCDKGLIHRAAGGFSGPVADVPPVSAIRADPSGDLWL